MDYGKLLKHAWKATWSNRWMWLLGTAIVSGGNGFQIFNLLPEDESSYSYPASSYNDAGEFFAEYWVLILLIILCGALLVLTLYVCHYIALGGMYAGAEAARKGEPVKFWPMVQAGLGSFWKNLGLAVLMTLVTIALIIIIGLPLLLLAFTGIGLIVVIPAFLMLLVLALPIGWIITTWYNLTTQYITLGNDSIRLAAKKAWQTGRQHWIPSLVVFAAQMGVGIAMGVVNFIVFGIIAVPVALFAYFAYTSQAWLAFGLAIAFGMSIFGLAMLLLKGIRQSFLAHLWHGYYAACQE